MKHWTSPPVALLEPTPPSKSTPELQDRDAVRRALQSAGISVESVTCEQGPQVMRYLVKLTAGTAPSKVERAIDAVSLQLERRARYGGIDGGAVAIEVERRSRDTVHLREVLEKTGALAALGFPVGLDVSGRAVTGLLAKMPHILVAGTTGAGKSAFVNSLLVSLLVRNKPNEMRLLMIDPKQVELAPYAALPHLLRAPIVDMMQAVDALREVVGIMEQRYAMFNDAKVKELSEYNDVAAAPLPRIVVVIDELADLMMTAPKPVEDAIARLGQKARAAGIHMVLATQRPAADVITRKITANVPARAVFAVQSHTDSKIALGMTGAEKLLGAGDGLVLLPGTGGPRRFQSPWVTSADVERVVKHYALQVEPEDAPEPEVEADDVPDVGDALRAQLDAQDLPWEREDAETFVSAEDVLNDLGISDGVLEALTVALSDRLLARIESRLLELGGAS